MLRQRSCRFTASRLDRDLCTLVRPKRTAKGLLDPRTSSRFWYLPEHPDCSEDDEEGDDLFGEPYAKGAIYADYTDEEGSEASESDNGSFINDGEEEDNSADDDDNNPSPSHSKRVCSS
jgi:hypothetical protein